MSTTELGRLFEQWVGLELLKWMNLHETTRPQLFFWRDHSGIEVDWVLKSDNQLIPIEVKWTESPSKQDIKYLKIFMEEYGCSKGYVVCRSPIPLMLSPEIMAIPWKNFTQVLRAPE